MAQTQQALEPPRTQCSGSGPLRVLVACEFTGIVRAAFRLLGHDAWSCDLEPTEYDSAHHIRADIRSVLDRNWDLMIAHPPCTYLTNAGVRHLDSGVASKNGIHASVCGIRRQHAMVEAAEFFNMLRAAPIPRIAIENPIPHKYARFLIGPYDQLIQPWQFGHPESKATCLWLKNLPKLRHTELSTGHRPAVHSEPDTARQSKNRSRTYPGIAVAMAEQWSLQ